MLPLVDRARVLLCLALTGGGMLACVWRQGAYS